MRFLLGGDRGRLARRRRIGLSARRAHQPVDGPIQPGRHPATARARQSGVAHDRAGERADVLVDEVARADESIVEEREQLRRKQLRPHVAAPGARRDDRHRKTLARRSGRSGQSSLPNPPRRASSRSDSASQPASRLRLALLEVLPHQALEVGDPLARRREVLLLVAAPRRQLPDRLLVVAQEGPRRALRGVGPHPEQAQRVGSRAGARCRASRGRCRSPRRPSARRRPACPPPRARMRSCGKCRRTACTISSRFSGSSTARTSSRAFSAPAARSRSRRDASP